MKIIVLGAGLVGGPMARDLSQDKDFEVTLVDISKKVLDKVAEGHEIITMVKDLSDPETVTSLVKDYDMVLSAVPGFMGYQTLKAIIEAGTDVVDIAFFPEDPFTLDALAKKNKVTAIVDCGVAPGMSNLLIGNAATKLDVIDKVRIYVGGLPEVRIKPFEYKAVFSPVDVIEEYTRPARLVRNGETITLPALSEIEELNFPEVGTLEAFNSDGLRTLIDTIECGDMAEKTLRYPGHAQMMKLFRDTGFFNEDAVILSDGTSVRPVEVTGKLFFKEWKMQKGDRDFTLMKIIVEGRKNNAHKRFEYDLFDRFDEEKNVHSMARTTGYTATVMVRLLSKGMYDEKGVSPPDFVGRKDENTEFMLEGLKERGVVYHLK